MLLLACLAALLFVVLLVVAARRGGGDLGEEWPARVDTLPRLDPPPPLTREADSMRFEPWRLVSRVLANPGSAGGPLYRLSFEPEGDLPQWQAGAVACIYCGPAAEALDGGVAVAARLGHYMVGSLPEEEAVELVVRLRADRSGRSDAAGGLRSQWLCEAVDTGQQVALALRDDASFTPPPSNIPLILIGNATGIAGLQAQIKARPAGSRNWLIFGDRGSVDDEVLAAAIGGWVSSGHLERCDLVLPGEVRKQRRVTDQLADASEAVLDWIFAGAAIYVCGSLPMGDDVNRMLAAQLGRDVLDAMRDQGLYRQALY